MRVVVTFILIFIFTIIFTILFTILFAILFAILLVKKRRESFVSHIYTPNYFEREKIKLYVSTHEKADELVQKYLTTDVDFLPTYEEPKNFKGDFALLPDTPLVLRQKEYKLVIPIHVLSYSIITLADNSPIKSFLDMDGKKLCIWPRHGYTEEVYLNLFKILNLQNPPILKEYDDEKVLHDYLNDRVIDGICILCNHPQTFVRDLTERLRIKILTWKREEKLEYYFPNNVNSTMNFSKYRLFTLNRFDEGYGVKLSLFADEKVSDEGVKYVMEKYGERSDGKVRNWVLSFSQNNDFHRGVLTYLKDKGYIVTRATENEACGLLAGKHQCDEGTELENTAKLFYSRDFIYNEDVNLDINENGTIPYLLETKKLRDQTNAVMKENPGTNPGTDQGTGLVVKIAKLEDLEDDKIITENVDVSFEKILDRLDSTLDMRWQCYGKTEYTTKEQCEEQRYTKEGKEEIKHVWDKPCILNDECPFYKANKNYKNERGGCIRGFCEMPLGIQRKAFTLYEETSKPICHGCKMLNRECCTIEKGMASSDYVFSDDKIGRISERKELEERNITGDAI